MPRYFFDVNTDQSVRDDVGVELADLAEVRVNALNIVSEFASTPWNLGAYGTIVVTVRDHYDVIAMVVRLVCQIEMPGI